MKTNKTGYIAIHEWVYQQAGKAFYCSNDPAHTAKRFEWANISGEYKKDLTDWKQLCPSCHRKFDYKPEYVKNLVRPVMKYTREGKFLKEFISCSEAAREVGSYPSAVVSVARGNYKSLRGFIYKYKDDILRNI